MKCDHLKPFTILLLSTALLLAFGGCSRMRVEPSDRPGPPLHLRTEYETNPLGIDSPAPRLSWEVNDPRRGARQSAYEILVGTGPDAEAQGGIPLWNTGRIRSAQSIQVPYGGPPLKSGRRYYWRVRTWDGAGRASAYSDPAFWEMGLLQEADWSAEWVETPPRKSERYEVPLGRWIWHPTAQGEQQLAFFRTSFTPDEGKEITSAIVSASADDNFRLYINGRLAARGQQWRLLTIENVAQFLKPGPNVVAVQSYNKEGPCGFVFGMKVTYADGTQSFLRSDAAWTACAQPAADWRDPECAAEGWVPAAVVGEYGAEPWGLLEPREPLGSEYLRKEFEISGEIASARAYATGLGLYVLCINGRRAGNDTLTPGWTHYPTRVQYQTYDVTSLLQPGPNAIGAILGAGWWGSQMAGDWQDSNPRLLCQLEIIYADGRTERIVTDGSWTAHPSPILENSLYHGECYDARLEQPGWAQPGFDDSAWTNVKPYGAATSRLVAQACPPIQVMGRLEPVAITEPRSGVYIFDFGQNHAGRVCLRVAGPRGTRVRLRHGEVLNADGTLYTANYGRARATDTYVLKGEGLETYEPRFTYRGFRYAEVTGYPGAPPQDALVSHIVHSSVKPAGSFSCSNALINRLQQAILWGQRSNLHSVPTDCPQRDERLGWTGDAQVFAPTACWNMDMARFFAKWMHDILDSQEPDGTVKNINPTLVKKPASPGWGDAITVIPWTVYRFYGDTRIIEENYEGMKKWVECMRRAAQDGLLYEREGYGDWVAPEPSPRKPIGAAYYYYSTRLLAEMAGVIGRTDDARHYAELARQIAEAFNEAYLDEQDNYPGATQTANLLPMQLGIVPPEHQAGVVQNIVRNIAARDGHLSTGFLGTPCLLEVLSSHKAHDTAWRLAIQETHPSWGYMLANGATTIWERWNGNRIEEVGADMNSFNHFAFGAIGEWFYQSLAGLNPDPGRPGFKHIIVRPRPAPGLTSASAAYQSMHGTLTCTWALAGDTFELALSIPANTSATLYLPASDPDLVLEGGRPAAEAPAVAPLHIDEAGIAAYEIGAGHYRFQSWLAQWPSLQGGNLSSE